MKRIDMRGGNVISISAVRALPPGCGPLSDYVRGIDAVLAEMGPTRGAKVRWFVDVFERAGELTAAQADRWRRRLGTRNASGSRGTGRPPNRVTRCDSPEPHPGSNGCLPRFLVHEGIRRRFD